MSKTLVRKTTAIIANLDPNAKARAVRETDAKAFPFQAERIAAKTTRHAVTREPDFIDEVTGEEVWLTPDLAVIVPVERANAFRAWISSHGLAPCGRDTFALHALTKDAPTSTWEAVLSAVR